MCWLWLALAILAETVGTTYMKLSDGLTKLVPTLLLFVFYGLSFALVTLAIKRIEVSVAYAIWSGAGTALIAMVGVVGFHESVTVLKIASLVLIILGVAGLNIGGGVP
jgi:small multidrug resistance pump